MNKPCNHTTLQEGLTPALLINTEGLLYPEKAIEMKVILTKTYLRKQALSFQYCPDCEENDIEYYGHTPKGTQKYHCHDCGRQFVSQRDSIYPSRTRREIFMKEFLDRQSTYDYWENAMLETLLYVESHQGKLLINKTLRNIFDGEISCQRDFEVLTLMVVRESYNYVMAIR